MDKPTDATTTAQNECIFLVLGKMRTWLELEARFRALVEPLKHLWLDAHWTSEVEDYIVFKFGGNAPAARKREFETLCGIAGRFLERSLDAESDVGRVIFRTADPVERWYVWLAKYGGAITPLRSRRRWRWLVAVLGKHR